MWVFVASYIGIAFLATAAGYGGFPTFTDQHELLDANFDKNQYETRYYEDERPEDDLVRHASIQSAVIKEDYLRLFIVHQKLVERTMSTKIWNNHSSKMSNDLSNPSKLAYFSDFYNISIDNNPVQKIKWKAYKHPKTEEWGIIALIPVKDLPSTEHTLEIKLKLDAPEKLKELKKFGLENDTYLLLSFWKNH
jgi:hypothetical protein